MTHTLWLARHGNREDFVDDTWRDSAERPDDPGLSPDGLEQAEQLAERIKAIPIDLIFASPYLRTVQTSQIIAERVNKPIYLEPGIGEKLSETYFSAEPEILSHSRLAADFPKVDLSHQPLVQPSFPEDDEANVTRMGKTARLITEKYGGILLFVGHGATVSGIVQALTGSPLDAAPLCSLTKLVKEKGTWRVAFSNDVSHLDEVEEEVRLN